LKQSRIGSNVPAQAGGFGDRSASAASRRIIDERAAELAYASLPWPARATHPLSTKEKSGVAGAGWMAGRFPRR